ncbi:unnamed protein product, partial [Iphiclides podalirius]
MRRKIFSLVLTSLLAAVLCQGVDDLFADFIKSQSIQTTTESDDDLNLDPVSEDTIGDRSVGVADTNVNECIAENGQRGVCVTYYLCEAESKTIIEDGYTLIDIRAMNECQNLLDTCCLRTHVISTPAPAQTLEEDKMNKAQSIGAHGAASATFTQTIAHNSIASPSSGAVGKCGYSNPGVHAFPVRDGGSPSDRLYADFGEYPWMVAVLKRSDDEDWKQENYIGGGSLIHPAVVMTVAHKLQKRQPNQIMVRAGDWDTNSEEELYDHQDRNVRKIVTHENYFRPSLYNDIGLLFLESPVALDNAPHIGIACLAPRPPPPSANCFSMGWGAADFKNKKVFASILKKVKLPLVPKDRCEEMLRNTRLGRVFRLHESLLCAGGEEGVDTCRGDGGSSLVCPIDSTGSRFAVYGMVAYGLQCGAKDVPGVYVNVPNLHGWVGQQLSNEGLDAKSYSYP